METRVEVDRLREVYRQYAALGYGAGKWSSANLGNQAIGRERERKTRELLEVAGFFPLRGQRILDVGCGTGEQLALFAEWGACPQDLFGVDLIPERIRSAQERFPSISFQLVNAESLPFPSGSFNLVAVFTVFSSILDPTMAARVSAEIARVLAPGGAVLWYDFRLNNPTNRHVRGISKKEILRLFPGFSAALERISLLPPLARRLGGLARLLYGPLVRLPVLRSHYLGLLTKPHPSVLDSDN